MKFQLTPVLLATAILREIQTEWLHVRTAFKMRKQSKLNMQIEKRRVDVNLSAGRGPSRTSLILSMSFEGFQAVLID